LCWVAAKNDDGAGWCCLFRGSDESVDDANDAVISEATDIYNDKHVAITFELGLSQNVEDINKQEEVFLSKPLLSLKYNPARRNMKFLQT